MSKRARASSTTSQGPSLKKLPNERPPFSPIKIGTEENAAAVDANTPLDQLEKVMQSTVEAPRPGKCVLYWMRMADLRIRDNRALSRAGTQAKELGLPLIVLFIISPQDYIAHDRGAKKIDFILRNLIVLKEKLLKLHIPLHIETCERRRAIPSFIVSFCDNYKVTSLFANLEYEVDELRRDLEVARLAASKELPANFFHNKSVIHPGVIVNKQGKGYAVYSPYLRVWEPTVNGDLAYYLEDCPLPWPNGDSIRRSGFFEPLFSSRVPACIEGFELSPEEGERMHHLWPAGEDPAHEILSRFLTSKARSSQLGSLGPLTDGAELCDKHNRAAKYGEQRDRTDRDSTSRLSPYLSCGVISIRECLRAGMASTRAKKVECTNKQQSGVGRWIQELAWRDFYTAILASYPRVSMGRPYLEKFASVTWEPHEIVDGEKRSEVEAFTRWKQGQTGVPIVDAVMRCLNEMGWVHNRGRMIAAMYLTKDLMIDWRAGERYFMQQLIDGDLSSNNGGWQWSASTGVDPCPYFRIFNPYSQSTKADPTGDFIRHFVPELNKLRGPDLHNPSVSAAEKLGYPLPIIPHNEARERALRRYKNPGTR